jgi:hypothetical protein
VITQMRSLVKNKKLKALKWKIGKFKIKLYFCAQLKTEKYKRYDIDK